MTGGSAFCTAAPGEENQPCGSLALSPWGDPRVAPTPSPLTPQSPSGSAEAPLPRRRVWQRLPFAVVFPALQAAVMLLALPERFCSPPLCRAFLAAGECKCVFTCISESPGKPRHKSAGGNATLQDFVHNVL